MTAKRIVTLLAASGALVTGRAWLLVAPGAAVRWASAKSDAGAVARSNEAALAVALGRAVVGVGARRPLRASCLEQGLALVLLLSIIKIPAHLVVAVTRSKQPESPLRAHAWVESRGDVLIGDSRSQEFVPILPRSRPTASSCPG